MLKELLVVICIWMYLFDFTKGVLEPVIKECNLTPAIEKLIQQHSHRYLPNASPEACIVTTNVSTLSESHPYVVPLLFSQHTVRFKADQPIKSNSKSKYANLVLIDATGFDEFPVHRFKQQLHDNPCHVIEARFIILVSRFCFIIDHPKIVQFFDDLGIVNYAIVQMPFSDFHSVDRFYVYTQNRFSKEKIVVRLSDIRNMHRLYPNKLANLYRHHIRIGVKQDDFPYVSISKNPDEIDGFLSQMFRDLGERILNLSFTVFHQNTEHYDADVYYDIIFQREHFQHMFAFSDMGGKCLFCPEIYTKNFFSHVLIPFAISGWIFVGGVFIVIWLLRLRFGTILRYDPILQTIFGVIGNDYSQTFPARVILFVLSCLSFFFSRTYTSRVLALMSLRTFYKRPKTIAEFMQSDIMMVIHKQDLLQYPLDDFLPKMLSLEEFDELRGRTGIQYHYLYCTLEPCGEARWLTSPVNHGYYHEFFVIDESILPFPRTLQFSENSPIAAAMHRYIGLFYETGLWDYHFKEYIYQLNVKPETETILSEVVFSFDDLTSLWILLGAGLLISTAIFIVELLSKKRT